MNNLAQKRKQSSLVILATVFGSAVVAAAPKVNLDSAKQIFLTVADVAMCMVIWDIYFQEKLYQKKIQSILLELFVVIMVSAITAYITSKGVTVLSDQLIAKLGKIGWGVIGAIAALAASLLGIAWTFYCDDLYKN
ncbi:MAG: hypothetical protein ACRC8K_08005 [Waterburya sp.]